MKLVKRKEVTKLMDESELYGNAEKERRKSDMVKTSAERWTVFLLLFRDQHDDVQTKTKIKTCNGKENIFIRFFNLALWLYWPQPNSLSCLVKQQKDIKKKMPPHASTFDLIWTIYFCLRYGQAETEVGVWRQIASIYSSKLKVLSWAVRAYFHFPLH